MARGLSISQQGIDLEDAQDSQKTLDTRIRNMDILVEKKVTLPKVSGVAHNITLHEHNLGFLPAFELYSIKQNKYMEPKSGFGSVDVQTLLYSGGLTSDKFRVTLFGHPFSFTDTLWDDNECILRIYNVAITEEYEAPLVTPTSRSTAKDTNYGVKILADHNDADITSEELINYTLNTKGKAFGIQKTGTVIAQQNTGGNATVKHGLGAPPNFLATFTDYSRTFVGPVAPDFIPVLASATNETITFRGAQAALVANVAYIIFKEFADLAI